MVGVIVKVKVGIEKEIMVKMMTTEEEKEKGPIIMGEEANLVIVI
jgi:hypothetical protein